MPTPSSIALNDRFPVGTRVRISAHSGDDDNAVKFGVVVPFTDAPTLTGHSDFYDAIGGVYVKESFAGPIRYVAVRREDNGRVYGYPAKRLTKQRKRPEPTDAELDAAIMARHILRPTAVEHTPENVMDAARRVLRDAENDRSPEAQAQDQAHAEAHFDSPTLTIRRVPRSETVDSLAGAALTRGVRVADFVQGERVLRYDDDGNAPSLRYDGPLDSENGTARALALVEQMHRRNREAVRRAEGA